MLSLPGLYFSCILMPQHLQSFFPQHPLIGCIPQKEQKNIFQNICNIFPVVTARRVCSAQCLYLSAYGMKMLLGWDLFPFSHFFLFVNYNNNSLVTEESLQPVIWWRPGCYWQQRAAACSSHQCLTSRQNEWGCCVWVRGALVLACACWTQFYRLNLWPSFCDLQQESSHKDFHIKYIGSLFCL